MQEKNTSLYICDICGKSNLNKEVIEDCENNCKEIKQLQDKVKPFHWYIMNWYSKPDDNINVFARDVKFIESNNVYKYAKIEIFDYVYHNQYYDVYSKAYKIKEILTPNEAYEKYNLIVPCINFYVKHPEDVLSNLNDIFDIARKNQYDLLIQKNKEELVNMIIDLKYNNGV